MTLAATSLMHFQSGFSLGQVGKSAERTTVGGWNRIWLNNSRQRKSTQLSVWQQSCTTTRLVFRLRIEASIYHPHFPALGQRPPETVVFERIRNRHAGDAAFEINC